MAPEKSELRWAGPVDYSTIVALLHEMHAEVGAFPLSHGKMEKRVTELLVDGGMVLIAYEGAAPVGTIGLYGGTVWYSEEQILMDSWIFTSARAKDRLSVFRALIEEVRSFAEQQGFPLVLTLYSTQDEKRKSDLFSRYGEMIMKGFQFIPVGGDYRIKEQR